MRKCAAVVVLLLSASLFAVEAPRLDRAEPFRLKVQNSGMVRVDVIGHYPSLKGGHPDMDQYEHWFVRRAGGAWELCTRLSASCRTSGWRSDMQSLELNAANWLSTPGSIEIRMNEGLSEDGNSSWPFSNVISVPVLEAFGAPPQIVSLSRKEFPSGGPESEFVFRIAANNFDAESAMVIFRGDTFVRPIRVIDGSQIEVAVPPNYRSADGELSFTLRTNSGGESAAQYFWVRKPKAATVLGGIKPITGIKPPKTVAVAGMTSLKVSPDVTLSNRVREAIAARIGAEATGRITVSSTGGVVTLSGALTAEQRAAAESAAANVSGVNRVVNQLTVQ